MEQMSLYQFREHYLQSFPQILDYPGRLEAPSGPLGAPVLVATVLEELVAHIQDGNYRMSSGIICHGEGCPEINGHETVTIKTVTVNWQPVGCADWFIYNLTSSSDPGLIVLVEGQDRTSVELCHHLPDEALMEFYGEEFKEGAAYSCVVAPSSALCGIAQLEVTAWRKDISQSSGREEGPTAELLVNTCALQGGDCVRKRDVTLFTGGGSLYTDRGGRCGEEEGGLVCGEENDRR